VAVVAVVAGLLVGALAQEVSSLKEEGEKFAQAFDIRRRPAQLDEGWIKGFLAELPGFGAQTIEVLEANAPYRTLSELASLTKETAQGPRRLLSDKQLLLIAIFFDLEP